MHQLNVPEPDAGLASDPRNGTPKHLCAILAVVLFGREVQEDPGRFREGDFAGHEF